MAMRGQLLLRGTAGLVSLCMLVVVPTSASAGNIFESIFGGLRRAVEAPRPPTNIQSFADPSPEAGTVNAPSERLTGGPTSAFCVRSCDGNYFPVRASPGLSAAEACHSFCPASRTRLYSGGNIDTAVAANGDRYADLPNAYVYRKQLVSSCTCNGREAFGLAHVDVANDPTLRPGDIVATKDGLMAFTGGKSRAAAFTPVLSYTGLPKNERSRLSELKIARPTPEAPAISVIPANVRETNHLSARLEK
jgi:Protein of unknown function (DUF2865)